MEVEKIRTDLLALLADQSLFDETKLFDRNEAIVYINYVGNVLRIPGYARELDPVYQRALILHKKLTAINDALYQRFRMMLHRDDINPESLRASFDRFTSYVPGEVGVTGYEYDSLDALLEQVIYSKTAPNESRERLPGMIRYEPTPARVILELIDSLRFTKQDIFYDLGSGLGLVVMLVNLLTGVRSVGVEYDLAYCDYARECADALNLENVTFIQSDVRSTDLNDGNIFYMFTPFVNEIYDGVMERLRYTSLRKEIYICAYGTITYDLVKLPWLQIRDPAMEHDFRLAIFKSI